MRIKAQDPKVFTLAAAVFAAILVAGGWSAASRVAAAEGAEVNVVSARVKVCKITLDRVNIPVGTAFTFVITGTSGAAPGVPNTSFAFDVLAGPAEQGGFCAFAPSTWVSGTPLFVGETGISASNTSTLPMGLEATKASLHMSSITSTNPFLTSAQSAAAFPGLAGLSNPELQNPAAGYVGHGVINANDSTAEVAFGAFLYRPAALRICNSAGRGVHVGEPYSFTVTPGDTLTQPFSIGPITIAAGSCAFVNGPYPPNPVLPGVGLFNQASVVAITEAFISNYHGISHLKSSTLAGTSPAGSLVADNFGRRGILSLNQPLVPNGNYNEISFTNTNTELPPRIIVPVDFDGDWTAGVAVFRPSEGTWYYTPSRTGQGFRPIPFGQAGDIPVAADYDGDGATDPAVFRNGQWYILGSSKGFSSVSFGLPSDIPQPGDYDGDFKADFAVFRPSNGTWYILGSQTRFKAIPFGIPTDVPVAADFDGDYKMDPAVFRNGTWYVLGSASGFSATQFGQTGDKPVQADYDGDLRNDMAVFRDGMWYIRASYRGFRAVQFGLPTDTPVPGDYDADAMADVAVYRPSNSTWYILNSGLPNNGQSGLTSMKFGTAGDMLLR